jgi:hypothetical protein
MVHYNVIVNCATTTTSGNTTVDLPSTTNFTPPAYLQGRVKMRLASLYLSHTDSSLGPYQIHLEYGAANPYSVHAYTNSNPTNILLLNTNDVASAPWVTRDIIPGVATLTVKVIDNSTASVATDLKYLRLQLEIVKE